MSQSHHHLQRLLRYYGKHLWLLMLSLGLVMASSATEVLLLSQIKTFIDTVFISKNPDLIWMVPSVLIGAFVLRGLLTFGATYINQWLLNTATSALRIDLFEHLLHLSDTTFKQEQSATILSKFTTDANNALSSLTELIVTLVRETALIIGIMGYLLWLNWQLTFIIILTLPISAYVARLLSSRLRSIAKHTQDNNALMIGAVKETIYAQRMIKLHNAYSFEHSRFYQLTHKLQRLAMRSATASAASAPLTQVIASLGVGAVMGLAIYQSQTHITQTVTAGVFTALLSNMVHLFQPLKQLANINGAYARTLAAADSVFDFLNQADERYINININRNNHKAITRPLPLSPLTIKVNHVSLQYPNSVNNALNNISFTLHAGQTTTLIGRSGSGKSSFASLLPRFIEPTDGNITLNDVPLNEMSLNDLRHQIAMVTQEPILIDDTVAANVMYGYDDNDNDNKPITTLEERLWKALTLAGLEETVKALPQGINTPIGEGGNRLSGGQRQRLTIARAFFKNAPILILDEATSALDSQSEAHIQATLKELQVGRTCLVITHRLHTIDSDSNIILLEAGQIIAQGLHRHLINTSMAYQQLYQHQS